MLIISYMLIISNTVVFVLIGGSINYVLKTDLILVIISVCFIRTFGSLKIFIQGIILYT
jgi:hypothetical protein